MSSYYHVSAEVSGCNLEKAHSALGAWLSSRVCQLSVLDDLDVVALDLMFYNGRTGMSADDFVEEIGATLAEVGITSAHIGVEVWDADVPTDSASTGWRSDGDENDEDDEDLLSDERSDGDDDGIQ